MRWPRRSMPRQAEAAPGSAARASACAAQRSAAQASASHFEWPGLGRGHAVQVRQQLVAHSMGSAVRRSACVEAGCQAACSSERHCPGVGAGRAGSGGARQRICQPCGQPRGAVLPGRSVSRCPLPRLCCAPCLASSAQACSRGCRPRVLCAPPGRSPQGDHSAARRRSPCSALCGASLAAGMS